MNYGLPYMGSKNRIAKDIINVLPSGERLVDLFAGGCAITHCGMLSGKWRSFLAEDIDASIPQLFLDAMNGKYKDETRWISREDFFRLKDEDAFVRTCWSFGNNGKDYMYSKKLEQYKRACHYAIMFDDWTEFEQLCPEVVDSAKQALDGLPTSTWEERKQRRKSFGPSVVAELKRIGASDKMIFSNPLYKSINLKWTKNGTLQSQERIDRLNALQALQSQERIDRLNALQGLKHLSASRLPLTTSALSYEEVEIVAGDVVYADPPYANTGHNYGQTFDHAKFWQWVATRNFPVYVSEYNAPEEFVEIFHKEKDRSAGGGTSKKYGRVLEKIFIHERWTQHEQEN